MKAIHKAAGIVATTGMTAALFLAPPAYADTDTPFGKGNCTARLQGFTTSDQSGSWEQLNVSSGCNANEPLVLQIQTELLFYGIASNGSRTEFVGPTTGGHLVKGPPNARQMLAQASAPPTGFDQYCASATVYYSGVAGDPSGGGTLTQDSGVVCWS
ncbi:hypothetical protein [Amycolatopsis azurea]|uniref:Secreted protein n=1 Tax=Amycolatopsis azurea DSM 43854 TaxID=1238180 RepID=M2NNV4_9PSEU|nr:hypothetical protein [Amycolatopsis azurea]EMD23869.1 hypothetical protein C791_6726 [Amycolatopsis azurea DSM 43854]OOC06857.1 hypothetical protein B0293_10315 [Amycolatopsis azurea DSM 43854]